MSLSRAKFSRPLAVQELKGYGIHGTDVYLLDIIPLFEMIWADGEMQGSERELLEQFMRQHVAHINRLAGSTVVTPEDAAKFLARFTSERPEPRLLETLRSLVPAASLSSSDAGSREKRRQAMLQWCLDIGAACASGDEDEAGQSRFNAEEKACFQAIFESLSASR